MNKKWYTITKGVLKGSLAFLQYFKFVNWWIRGFVFLMSRAGYMIHPVHHTRYLAPRGTNTCAIDWWHQDLVFLFFRDMSVKKPITRNIEAKDRFFFDFCSKLLSFLKSGFWIRRIQLSWGGLGFFQLSGFPPSYSANVYLLAKIHQTKMLVTCQSFGDLFFI